MMKNKKYFAFTLAEMLIALSILAIISVMTVPALRDDAQKKENAAKATKAYASIAQVFDFMEAQLPSSLWTEAWATEQITKQLNTVGNSCFPGTTLRFPGGSSDSNYGSGNSFLLADGTCVKLSYANNASLANTWGMGSGNYMYSVYVDVNGANRPNVWGQDVFLFALVPGRGLVPSGANGCAQDSYGCAANVIKKGKTE